MFLIDCNQLGEYIEVTGQMKFKGNIYLHHHLVIDKHKIKWIHALYVVDELPKRALIVANP